MVTLEASLVITRLRHGQGQLLWRCEQGQPSWWWRQQTAGAWSDRSRRWPVDLHELHLVRQTHRGSKGLGIVDVHRVTQGWKEAAGEELDPLGFVKPTGMGQEHLKPIGIVLDGPCASALRKLEHRG